MRDFRRFWKARGRKSAYVWNGDLLASTERVKGVGLMGLNVVLLKAGLAAWTDAGTDADPTHGGWQPVLNRYHCLLQCQGATKRR
jgi:hypothetical protein